MRWNDNFDEQYIEYATLILVNELYIYSSALINKPPSCSPYSHSHRRKFLSVC